MTEAFTESSGTLETPQDAGAGGRGEVKRWMLEINLASKVENAWRKESVRIKKIYRGEKRTENSFNILWANTQIIIPNLYNSTPRPDVRRRYRDADPEGKQVAEVLERALEYEMDNCEFDHALKGVVFDSALPGRGVARVRLEVQYGQDNESIASASVYPELWQWDRFRRGPGATWEQVPWIAYEHHLTKKEAEKKFPNLGKKLEYGITMDGADGNQAEQEPSVFKRVLIWEVWDKEERKIFWICPNYPDAPLLVEDDKLGLAGFFDTPRPLYSISDTTTLDPIPEYKMYEDQAKELNRITARINNLIKGLKVRGIYDSVITEMAELIKAGDNELVPVVNSGLAMANGGLEKAIWLMPVEQIAAVVTQLYQQREQVKSVIYEIVGISDILRGQSDPNETLGAQEIKVSNSSVRLQDRQREVQRYARDLMRIMSEIMAEHYPPEILTIITGVNVTPQMSEILKRDLLRGIRVDIETDSTIAADQTKDRKDVAEIMEGVGGFVKNFGPAIEAQAISMDAGRKILLSMLRKAKLGREVEDAIEEDNIKQSQQQGQPKPPTPEEEALRSQQQLEQQKAQASLQMDQQRLSLDQQNAVANHQMEMQKIDSQNKIELQKLALEEKKILLEAENERLKIERETQFAKEKLMAELQQKLAIEQIKISSENQLQHQQMHLSFQQDEQKARAEEGNNQSTEIANGLEKTIKEMITEITASKKVDVSRDAKGNIAGLEIRVI